MNRHYLITLIFIFIILSLGACQSSEAGMRFGGSNSSSKQVTYSSSSDAQEKAGDEKIIRSARLSGIVSSIYESRASLDSILLLHSGHIASEDQQMNSNGERTSLVIKVDNASFYESVSSIEGILEKRKFKKISSENVSMEYIDAESRLDTKRKVLSRYQDFLTVAKNIEEILDVEEHVRKIQEEIESTEVKLRYLDEQISWSTIHLTLEQSSESMAAAQGSWFITELGQAIKAGWSGFIKVGIGLVYVWPWLLMAFMIFLIGRKKKGWLQRVKSVPAES